MPKRNVKNHYMIQGRILPIADWTEIKRFATIEAARLSLHNMQVGNPNHSYRIMEILDEPQYLTTI